MKSRKDSCRYSIEKPKLSLLLALIGLIGLGLAGIISGCTAGRGRGLKEFSQTRPYLGAYVTIRCFYEEKADIAAAVRKCWERMDEIQLEMNAYAENSDVALINRSGIQGARVRKDVYRLLKGALDISRLTDGAFDVTVFPLVEFWRLAAKEGRLPDEAVIAAVKARVGYQNLRLEEPDRVIPTRPGMKVDLGGIVSGYACDEIAAILESYGIKDFLIDTGGEIFCRGNKGREGPWLIGLQDPRNKGNILMTLKLKDACVSTSGNYEKFYSIEGKKFSHIIDPISGYPQKGVLSATVVANSGTLADALSTALCVLGGERGMPLIKGINSVQALVIEDKNGVTLKFQTEKFPYLTR